MAENSIDRRASKLKLAASREQSIYEDVAKVPDGGKPAYMDIKRVVFETSYSESTIENLLRLCKFPRPRNKCGKRVWKWIEIEAFMDREDDAPLSEAERICQATKRLSNA